MNWSAIFDEALPESGASDADLEHFVSEIARPPSPDEVLAINQLQLNPFPPEHPLHAAYRPLDPTAWDMPARPLPHSYLSLLRWSNGGWARSGEREFGFFSTTGPGGVREMMLAYQIPEYMPGALPFAFNGGGTFYLFDLRCDAIAGEYPIVCAHAGNLGWAADEFTVVAETLEAACRGTINVDKLRNPGPDVQPPDKVDVYVIRVPHGGVARLRSACNHLGVVVPVTELPAILQQLPYRLQHNVPYLPAARLVSELSSDDPCLGVFTVGDPYDPVSLPPWEWK